MSKRESGGASGSWAEPYFACPTLRYGGLEYTQSILCPLGDSVKAFFSILVSILWFDSHINLVDLCNSKLIQICSILELLNPI